MPDPSQVILRFPRFSRRKRPTAIITPLMQGLEKAGVVLTPTAKRQIRAFLTVKLKAAQVKV